MKLTNYDIISKAESLKQHFLIENKDKYLPIRLNFAIQKNLTTLLQQYSSLDALRKKIYEHYGTLNEDKTRYNFDSDKINIVNSELQDLYALEVDVDIIMIKLSTIEDLELTSNQMESIMFMIEE